MMTNILDRVRDRSHAPIAMFSAALALGTLACTPETPTEASGALSAAKGAAAYTAIDLQAYGGDPTFPSSCCDYAAGINAAGQIVGTSEVPGSPVHAILWAKGQATDLGTLGEISWSSQGQDINAAGQIVGFAGTLEGLHAVLWDHGAITDLGALGGPQSRASGINASGQVVGGVQPERDGPMHAFLWEKGVMADLGLLGGLSTQATDINSAGQIVGWSYTGDGEEPRQAFLWEKGVVTILGTLGGVTTVANGINSAGQVVGYSQTADDQPFHAFLWTKGVMTDLGTLGGQGNSVANDINNAGVVAGQSNGDAVIWNHGEIIDLGPGNALGINDRGDVVGVTLGLFDVAESRYHATLWKRR
jgi:probable HAF family extracellular repeat protein